MNWPRWPACTASAGTVMAPEIVSSVRTGGDKLPRPKLAIGVIERALQMDGSGGRIDDVIDDGERPGGRTIRRILREGLHLQFAISAEAPDGGEVLFRHVEIDEEWAPPDGSRRAGRRSP